MPELQRRHVVTLQRSPESRTSVRVSVSKTGGVQLLTHQKGRPRTIGAVRVEADLLDDVIDALTAAKNALGQK